MVRPDVAEQKVSRAASRLDQAEALLARPRDAFVADLQGRDLASFYLLVAIQEVIDLAAHWVADAGWPAPPDAAATFDLLAEHGALGHEQAAGLRAAVGLRNRIAHGYATLDDGRLYDELQQGVTTLRHFLAAVAGL